MAQERLEDFRRRSKAEASWSVNGGRLPPHMTSEVVSRRPVLSLVGDTALQAFLDAKLLNRIEKSHKRRMPKRKKQGDSMSKYWPQQSSVLP